MPCVMADLTDRLGLTSRRILQLEHENVLDRRRAIGWNENRYRIYSTDSIDVLAEEIGRLAKSLDSGMTRMSEIDDIEKRRKLGLKVGPLIGQFSEAMDLANAMARPSQRPLLNDYTIMLVGRTVRQFLELMRWNVAEDEIEPSPGSQEALTLKWALSAGTCRDPSRGARWKLDRDHRGDEPFSRLGGETTRPRSQGYRIR